MLRARGPAAAAGLAVLVVRLHIRRRRTAARRCAELDRHIGTADGCSPTEFEHLVARLLTRDGYREVRVVSGAADGQRLVVQCKGCGGRRYVSSPDVQRFLGTCFGPSTL